MLHRWRLIRDEPRDAALNMAVDEAILRSCAQGSSPPTLRIYSWLRPSISLGYFQAPDLDLDYCREAGIEVVRRITGGRAVIHGWDVTFSISLGERDLPEGHGSVLESHRWLMGGIVAGLRLLGAQAQIGPEAPIHSEERREINARSSDCFAHVAECDVRVGGEKAVGSAQARRHGGLLEQGSIPYAQPEVDFERLFGGFHRLLSCASWLPSQASFKEIADAVSRGFAEELQIRLEAGSLAAGEIEAAKELARDKYASHNWTHRQP